MIYKIKPKECLVNPTGTPKTCRICKKTRLSSEFSNSKDRKDGKCGHCKHCDKARYAAIPRKRVRLFGPWKKGRSLESKRRMNQRKIQKRREKLATDEIYRAKMRRLYVKYAAKRRARKRKAAAEDVDRLVALEKGGGRCYLCGKELTESTMHLDHVVPLVRGGPHSYSNCRPACAKCNQRKSFRTPLELMMR